MKYLNIIIFFIIAIILKSCSFDDVEMEYEEKLVIFASVSANLPVIDTVLISKTAAIQDSNIQANDLWVNDAQVRLIEPSTNSVLNFYNVGSGKYFPITDEASNDDYINYLNYIIKPGETYRLAVNHDMGSVIAETLVPSEMNIRPVDLGNYICPDGTELSTDIIDVNNLDGLSIDQLASLAVDSESFISQYNINVDTITFRFGDCYTKSFASYPMFGVDFDSDNYQTIKTLTFALDANKKGLEPLKETIGSINAPSFVDPDSGLFYDYNYNEIRDSIFVNLIYDTTLGFRIWKGSYFRTMDNTPYRINPWQWNIEESPTQIPWLYFDYYGLNLMTFKATSESYFDYFSGDPVGQNIYLLPDSNLEGGLGVFYSSYESRFLVFVKQDDSEN